MAEFYDVVISTEVKHRRNVKPDALHWNSIEKKLEYWDGTAWVEVGANLDELKILLETLENDLRTDLEEGDRASLEAAGQAVQAAVAAQETANAAKTSADAASDAAVRAQASADAKVATVNGNPPDENGNVEAGGLPLGFEYFQTNPNVQAGSLPMVGGEWSRTIYADLWEWVQEQPGYLITEAEWQAKASANGGAVPFYSDGDGATTFRVPALTVWCKGAGGNEAVGDYLADMFGSHKHNVTVEASGSTAEAGGHTHTRGSMNITGSLSVATGYTTSNISGAFYTNGSSGDAAWSGSHARTNITFDASRSWTGETSNAGNHSHTVTLNTTVSEDEQGGTETRPRTIVGLYCVVAYGAVTSSGAIDLDDVRDLLLETQEVVEEASKGLEPVRETAEEALQAAATAQSTADTAAQDAESANRAVSGLAAVAKTGNYNDLSNKPSIPATPNAYVVTAYNSGNQGYRKWSDGFIEQWGRFTTSAGENTRSFPTAFAAYCSVQASYEYNSSSGMYLRNRSYGSSTTSFKIYASSGMVCNWYACGY